MSLSRLEPRACPPRPSEAGTSLVELMVAVAMVGVVLVAVGRFTSSTRANLLRQENTGTLTSMSSRISSNLRTTLKDSSALLLDSGGGEFAEIRARLLSATAAAGLAPFPTQFAKIVNSSLPRDAGPTSADGADWGNAIAWVSPLQPLTYTVRVYASCLTCSAMALPVNTTYTVGVNVAVDRFQFAMIFLALEDPARPPDSIRNFPQLVEWRSKPYVDYASLLAVKDTSTTVHDLTCAWLALGGYDYAWALNQLSDTAGVEASPRLIDNSALLPVNNSLVPATHSWGRLQDYTMSQDPDALPDKPKGWVRVNAYSSASAPSHYGIAFNTSYTASPSLSLVSLNGTRGLLRVPLYTQPGMGGAGGPGGFEVTVIGTPGVREIYMRHVLMVRAGIEATLKPRSYRGNEFYTRIAVRNER